MIAFGLAVRGFKWAGKESAGLCLVLVNWFLMRSLTLSLLDGSCSVSL